MTHYLIEQGYIPLDKSWMIRMGVLDLLNNYEDTIQFLERQEQLSNDLQALHQALLDWKSERPVYVGESGTLYRFLRFASWKLSLNKEFVLEGTLEKRAKKFYNNPEIINWPLEKLLKLDYGTSQWASASVLLGNTVKVKNPPHKLQLTYNAVEHWKKQRAIGKCWEPRYDEIILTQAIAYLDILHNRKLRFVPQQPEDYCFARVFGFVTKEQGRFKWSSLKGHESDRIEEMERMLCNADKGIEIDSKDHRVIQAVAMRQKIKNKTIKIKYPLAVNKSWPQFWKFLNDSSNL